MHFNAVEILALILIAIAVIKLAVFIYNPELWFNFIEKIYSVPQLISIVGFFSSIVVLYFLINAGITIVEILAVSLFIALLMVTGLANYADQIVGWVKEQDIVLMMKRVWLYSIAWLFMIVWGIRELFFK